jgi:hypothetical protein
VDVDAVPVKRRGTKKKVWDESTSSWQDVTIWIVQSDQELCVWLEEFYPDKQGWGTCFSDTKIIMEEKVYMHYCLKFNP